MFLVVFRNRKRADIDYPAYETDAERMLELEPDLARAHLERWFGSRHDYLNA